MTSYKLLDSPAFKGKPKIVIIRTYSFEGSVDKLSRNCTQFLGSDGTKG